MFRQLVARSFVNVDFDGHGALQLNNLCRPLLRGEEAIEFRQDRYEQPAYELKTGAQAEAGRVVVRDSEKELWEALRALRRSLAEAQEVPAYIIVNDKTLFEMLRVKPTDMKSFGRVNGIGQYKLEKYGNAFLTLLRQYQGMKPLNPAEDFSKVIALAKEGVEVAVIAEQLSLTEGAVYGLLAKAIHQSDIGVERYYCSVGDGAECY